MAAAPVARGVDVSLVLFHSDPDLVRATCVGLSRQTLLPRCVRIHINEADDDEARATRDLLPGGLSWEVTASSDNRGFCGAHNDQLAASWLAGADAVLVLNPDVVLEPEALAVLVAASDAHGSLCLAGPLLELADRNLAATGLIDSAGITWTSSGRHLDSLQGEPLAAAPVDVSRVAGLTGACLLVPEPAYRHIVTGTGEFFDEAFLAYREDAELSLRCAWLGVDRVLVPQARGRHGRQLRGTSRAVSAHVNRLGVQNRFLIRFKHGRHRPGVWPLPALRDALVILAVITRERASLPGLRQALTLRKAMRAKGRRLYAGKAELASGD